MQLKFINNNIFSGKEPAIILTVDGSAKGMEGNIARTFARLYPECWEELNFDVEYPIPLGQSRLYEIDKDLAEDENSPYRYVIVASTLHHLETMDNTQKIQVISRALVSALSLAAQKGVKQLATTLLSGGWRLSEMEALRAMVNAYEQFAKANKNLPTLNIYIIEKEKYDLAIDKFVL